MADYLDLLSSNLSNVDKRVNKYSVLLWPAVLQWWNAVGTTSCIIIKQKLFIFHHLHYCANRKNNKSKNSFISQIFLFSNRNCCDSKHFVSLLQNIFIKMRKYFLVGFSRMTVMQVTGGWLMLMIVAEQVLILSHK